jgi:hypothetical protein
MVENYKFFERKFGNINQIARMTLSRNSNVDHNRQLTRLTGLDLSQADLIRNYMLMGREAKEQEKNLMPTVVRWTTTIQNTLIDSCVIF